MMDASASSAHHEEAVVDEGHPWPGLVPFREAYSRFFFGRSLEQQELLRSIRRGITTLLFGESGLGKTSLLQAGLFPRLRENGYLPVLVRLDYAPEALPPSEQIKLLVNQAIVKADLDATRSIEPQETLWEYFHRRERALIDRSGEPVIPIIVFDQFEEFFTLGFNQRKADCQVFLAELSDLTENRPPAAVKARLERSPEQIASYAFGRDDYRIVITVREDFLPALEVFRPTAPSLGRNRFRLTRMKAPQALEAVVEPGREIVDEDVAQGIVSLVGGATAIDISPDAFRDVEVEPSLLSLFCSELNERRLAGNLPKITAELVELSQRDILRSFYERTLKDQPRAVREFIEDQLVTDSGARDSIARERADRLLAEKGVPASVIDELVRRRLLHVEERREGPRVELIHDVLLDIVRQSKAERSGLTLRQALARTRKRYIVRAAAAVAIVTLLAGGVTFMALAVASLRNEQNKRLDEQNQELTAYKNKLEEQNERLDEQNQQLTAYKNRLEDLLDNLMPVLGKFVERNEGQSLTGDNFFEEQVRPLMNQIIELSDQMRGSRYEARFMSAKALSLVILAKVANPDDRLKYMDDATQMAADLLQQSKNSDDASKGYFVFDAITQVWSSRGSLDQALGSVRKSLEILQQISPAVLSKDERNVLVGTSVMTEAEILKKASRFDEAEQRLRWGVGQLVNSAVASPLSVLVDLYNNLGNLLLSARDRAADEKVKRSAVDAALVEFVHAWDDVVVYSRLQDSIATRNWMARHARKIAGLYEDIHNVEQGRVFYGHEVKIRRSLVPEDESKLTIRYDVDAAKRDLAAALRDIGYLEETQGDKSKAAQYCTECMASMEALVRNNPAPANRLALGHCYVELGDTLLADNKRSEALANYQNALPIREELAAAEPNNADRDVRRQGVRRRLASRWPANRGTCQLPEGNRDPRKARGWRARQCRPAERPCIRLQGVR
jgi:tetratricopeptide (TPR) repeat protein